MNVTLKMTDPQKKYIREELFSRGGEPEIDAFIDLLDRQGLSVVMTIEEAKFLRSDIKLQMIENIEQGGGYGDVRDQSALKMLRRVVENITSAIQGALSSGPPGLASNPSDKAPRSSRLNSERQGVKDRETPRDWVWAYHVTPEKNLPSITVEGLKPTLHAHVPDFPVIFVEPDLDGVEPYYAEGMAILRFKTPGFGSTEDGESVIFGGNPTGGTPEAPLTGAPGEDGVVLPERIQVLFDRRFRWLVE